MQLRPPDRAGLMRVRLGDRGLSLALEAAGKLAVVDA
jgi:hypothetical protein